ncbi:hypothetical protein ASPCAL12475 [Aspergillus calidoustus]|uniref:Zn(2)-C6 fungal-type domain-containing protein n=1 Tax=Aspergillus calidoustus TaxID=454130 RepID=A0A0U5CFX5_ASPCI|nr:hypothetical protein ASPCAL12475 [Aspergillus calidoustus]
MLSRPRSRPAKRSRYNEFALQADLIEKDGFPVDNPCERCALGNFPCVMDSKSTNCAACTRRGRKCEKRFHGARDVEKVIRDDEKYAAELEAAEAELERVMAKIKRLRKMKKFNKERMGDIISHNGALLDRLDEEDPLTAEDLRELERLADEHDAAVAQLAATSDNPSLTQMIGSPSSPFWQNVDFSTFEVLDRFPCVFRV